MGLLTKGVRGTRDVLPSDSHLQRFVEQVALETAENFGYREIRTPVFEHTELFERGVGDTTDVVQKEMYSFFDKGGRSITLRPEGTAGAARACLEHGLLAEALPVKVSYVTDCYRYEKPQAGRYRAFSQFGVECFGTAKAAADAELIALAMAVFATLGASEFRLELNSIGCPQCRPRYLAALQAYFSARQTELCETCHVRLQKNPMRILDCKSPVCSHVARAAPVISAFLCGDCQTHFNELRALLEGLELPYVLNPKIVRGLDYYTRTVFEFISEVPELEGLVLGGGGRYDGLIEALGGAPTPSLGFALGLERLLLHLRVTETELPQREPCALYIAAVGAAAELQAMRLVRDLRAEGMNAQADIVGRSLKAQMKYADKIGAQYTLVLGDSELQEGTVQLKDMQTGGVQSLPLHDFAEQFERLLLRLTQEELQAQWDV